MDSLRRSRLSKWIRGAQITHHEFIMFWQSVKVTIGLAVVLVVLTVGGFAWNELDHHERGIAFRSVLASGMVIAGVSKEYPIYYTDREGNELSVPARVFYESETAKAVWAKARKGMWRGFMVSIPIFIIAIIAFIRVFDRAGKNQTNDSYVRGARLTKSGKELQKALEKEGRIGPLPIGPVQLPHDYEASHQLFIGGPGSGKTVLLSKQLEAIRKAKRRAIVYDVNGTFVERFYDPNRDVILNPLEDRSPVWRIWDEVRLESDYHAFAQAVIPDSTTGSDTFWTEAARATLRATLKKLAEIHDGSPTNEDLHKAITTMATKPFAAMLEDTEAGSIIDPGAEKMVIGIRATIAAKLTGFSFLADVDKNGELLPAHRRFSIKDFIKNEDHDGWLFITSKNDQLASLRQLITLWVDIAVGEVLSLKPDPSRRLYFVFDELPSLSQLPSLQSAMAQGRKHGAAVILGLQSIEQLRDIYGQKQAEAITGNCATWTTLRANDTETSKWISDAIGMTEKAETSEGLSVAGNDIGDRRTTQRQIVARATVLPSELRGLQNLQGYLVMGRGHPVLKFDFPYEPYRPKAPDFVMRSELLDVPGGSKSGFSSSPNTGPKLAYEPLFSSEKAAGKRHPTSSGADTARAEKREREAKGLRRKAELDLREAVAGPSTKRGRESKRPEDEDGYGALLSKARDGDHLGAVRFDDLAEKGEDRATAEGGDRIEDLEIERKQPEGELAAAILPETDSDGDNTEDEFAMGSWGAKKTLEGMSDV